MTGTISEIIGAWLRLAELREADAARSEAVGQDIAAAHARGQAEGLRMAAGALRATEVTT